MERFKVLNAVRINEGVAEGYDYFNLTLQNSKGVTLPLPVQVTRKYILNVLRQEELPVDELTDRQVLRLVKSLQISGTIQKKEEGEEFIADEFTGIVNVGTKDQPEWKPAKKGQTYKVHMTGYWINYREQVIFSINDDLADKFAMQVHQTQQLMQLQTQE